MLDNNLIKEIKRGRYCIINGDSIWCKDLLVVGLDYQEASKELVELLLYAKTIEEHIQYQRYISKYYDVDIIDVTKAINKIIQSVTTKDQVIC